MRVRSQTVSRSNCRGSCSILSSRKREIARTYLDVLDGFPHVTLPVERPGCRNVYWMFSLLINEGFGRTKNEVMAALKDRGVDSRSFFYPMSEQPAMRQVPSSSRARHGRRRPAKLTAVARGPDQLRLKGISSSAIAGAALGFGLASSWAWRNAKDIDFLPSFELVLIQAESQNFFPRIVASLL